jgi:hypothetical protein
VKIDVPIVLLAKDTLLLMEVMFSQKQNNALVINIAKLMPSLPIEAN